MQKWARLFVRATSVVLLLTRVAKLLTLPSGNQVAREFIEPLSQLPWWTVATLAGVWELALGVVTWRVRPLRRNLLLVAGTAAVLLLYRAALWLMGSDQPCPCLGRVGEWMLIPPAAADPLLMALLVFWLAGGLIFLVLGTEDEPCGGNDRSKDPKRVVVA